MNRDRLNILYLGCSGFPYGLAEVQRILLISKALIAENAKVTVICSTGIHNKNNYPDLKRIGQHEGVNFIYSNGTPYRNSNLILRNIVKPFAKILEFLTIYKIYKEDRIDAAIISSMNFRDLLIYRYISKILNFNTLLNLVEVNSSMSGQKGIKTKINNYLFDHYAIQLSDGILPISEYLINLIKNVDLKKPYLKIPVIVDLNRYIGVEVNSEKQYFLYCGAAAYFEVILFIVDTFELIEDNEIYLYLVINGVASHLSLIEKRVFESDKRMFIRIFSKMTDKELTILYKSALALLIPLRSTIQDKARFPHKIGEYLASGRPMITTSMGEIPYYLEDMKNALIADNFNKKEFYSKMQFVINNPEQSAKIGSNGIFVAKTYFNYRNYGQKILELIYDLKQ